MDKDKFDTLTRRWVARGGSRRTLLRWAGVLALPGLHALGSPAARAAEVADAQCPSGTFSSYERKVIGQTFKAQHTGKLTRATVYAVAPSATNTDDYRIEIWTTNRKGMPKAGLAFAYINNIVRPPAGQTMEVTANFLTPARVTKGKRYGLGIASLSSGVPVSLLSNRPPGETTPNCPGRQPVRRQRKRRHVHQRHQHRHRLCHLREESVSTRRRP
jgi:hypothetical protein